VACGRVRCVCARVSTTCEGAIGVRATVRGARAAVSVRREGVNAVRGRVRCMRVAVRLNFGDVWAMRCPARWRFGGARWTRVGESVVRGEVEWRRGPSADEALRKVFG
jgi:hypothetical protein